VTAVESALEGSLSAQIKHAGHKTRAAAEYAAAVGERARVGGVVLFRHRPDRTDDELDEIARLTRAIPFWRVVGTYMSQTTPSSSRRPPPAPRNPPPRPLPALCGAQPQDSRTLRQRPVGGRAQDSRSPSRSAAARTAAAKDQSGEDASPMRELTA